MTPQLPTGETAEPATCDGVVAAPGALPGRNVLVVIGIDAYQHWGILRNAVSDANGARKLFMALGFEEVIAPLLNGAATGAALDELVKDTLGKGGPAALRPADSLVVFYAGHGGVRTVERDGKQVRIGHLIPADAVLDRYSTWTNLEAWLGAVSLLPPRHILVILDACFSGIALGPTIRWRGEVSSNEPLATLHGRPSRRIITSALDNERALDSGPVAGHSLFTGALIEALTGGVASTGDTITGSELAMWVRRRVRSYAYARQTPDFGAFDHDDRGEIAIPVRRRADGRPLAGAPAPPPPSAPVEIAIEPADRAHRVVDRGTSGARRSRTPRRWLRAWWRERDWWFVWATLLAALVIATLSARGC